MQLAYMSEKAKKLFRKNKMTEQNNISFGAKAVGLTFNPSNDPSVQHIKTIYAGLIDALDGDRNEAGMGGEAKRQFSVAITELQTSQMWAVKAITWKD